MINYKLDDQKPNNTEKLKNWMMHPYSFSNFLGELWMERSKQSDYNNLTFKNC